ncbi:MAG: hypothetical protein DME49_09215 [Verrucomicrobia bacterium]|nr:MAG: hypothetical protein DME49_09215 [Verrucomicrobiota bacterium]
MWHRSEVNSKFEKRKGPVWLGSIFDLEIKDRQLWRLPLGSSPNDEHASCFSFGWRRHGLVVAVLILVFCENSRSLQPVGTFTASYEI